MFLQRPVNLPVARRPRNGPAPPYRSPTRVSPRCLRAIRTPCAVFRTLFPNDLVFEGQRAIVFRVGLPIPREETAFCLGAALTYHLRKKTASRHGAQARSSAPRRPTPLEP